MVKTKSDIIEARIALLMQMDLYVRNHVNDEEYIVNVWFSNGIPDAANMSDYEFIADCDEVFEGVCKTFAKICLK